MPEMFQSVDATLKKEFVHRPVIESNILDFELLKDNHMKMTQRFTVLQKRQMQSPGRSNNLRMVPKMKQLGPRIPEHEPRWYYKGIKSPQRSPKIDDKIGV